MPNDHHIAESFSPPMEKIDGARVRQLRESNNLTQLYLATAVGVTTDTISRWENKKYPTIKRDNAEKLAEVLGVNLADIQEKQENQLGIAGESESADSIGEDALFLHPPNHTATSPLAKKSKVIIAVGTILLLIILAIWKFNAMQFTDQRVTARRSLPNQAIVNRPFPVLIILEDTDRSAEPATFILKEILPAGTEIISAVPHPTNLDHEKNALKWIGRTNEPRLVFGYLAKIRTTESADQPRLFKGAITIKSANGKTEVIAGNSAIRIGFHHWADTNRDNRIDDDEILAVYDTYDGIKGLNVDIEEIDAIWSAHGYRWNETQGKLEIIHGS